MRSLNRNSQLNLQLVFITLASTGLLFLGACANKAANSTSNSNSEITTNTTKTETLSKSENIAKSEKNIDHSQSSKGGQVVETGKYHLEFVSEKEQTGTHLDFYLQTGDTHAVVTNAKVTADIQSPDGKQTTIPLAYDADGKHYAAKLNTGVSGQYQVKINADIAGEKVNGRFNFNR
ncbi:MAG: hypothetical protein VKN72_17570 [Nostocales cyanobacterium 94392]|nr:hypothetical protein [Nostocales cyanobacterium 94392]